MRRANFEIVLNETTDVVVVIRDVGPWDQHATVTNAAEHVVAELHGKFGLKGRRLFYYDSDGRRDELLHDGAGRFTGFGPGAIAIADTPEIVAETLAEARAAIPPGLYRLERNDQDEPQILETWL